MTTSLHEHAADSGRISRAWDLPLLGASVGAALLLVAVSWPTLQFWNWEYTKPHSYYAHGFFIPLLAAVMVWHHREALRRVEKRPAISALFFLVPAIALQVFSQKSDMQALMSWSFLIATISSVFFVAGKKFARILSFPMFFLWGMAPLPGPLLNDLTLKMQSSSTALGAIYLKLIGFGAIREGNFIRMDNFTLNVDVPCSGFNLLLRLITFSMAFSYLTDTTNVRRVGIFLFSLPLSLIVNSIRVAMIGIVGECFGSTAAQTFHDWGGLLSLILCMTILFGFAKVLGCKTFAGQPIF